MNINFGKQIVLKRFELTLTTKINIKRIKEFSIINKKILLNIINVAWIFFCCVKY